MKKSLILFAAIVIAFFMVDRLVFLWLNKLEQTIYSGGTIGKVNTFFKCKDSVDILIFGSSRAVHHVNPDVFSVPAYNMGMDATRIGYATALITTLQKRDQVILIHIDHNRVFDETFDGSDALSLKNLLFRNKNIKEFYKSYFPSEIYKANISRMYVFNGKVFSIIKNKFLGDKDTIQNGYLPLYQTKEQKQIFEILLKEKKFNINENINKPLVVNKLFEEFVNLILEKASNNNSKVVFFTSPSLNKVDREVEVATKKFFVKKNVPYYNYLNYLDSFPSRTTYFRDFTHLTAAGAEAFSKKIKEDLDEIL